MAHSFHKQAKQGGSSCHGAKEGGFHGNFGKVLGTTTIGERGQVVIPREAREELDITGGERFVVFGDKRKGAVILVKSDIFNRFAEIFMSKSKKLEKLAQEILDATNSPEGEEDTDPMEDDPSETFSKKTPEQAVDDAVVPGSEK